MGARKVRGVLGDDGGLRGGLVQGAYGCISTLVVLAVLSSCRETKGAYRSDHWRGMAGGVSDACCEPEQNSRPGAASGVDDAVPIDEEVIVKNWFEPFERGDRDQCNRRLAEEEAAAVMQALAANWEDPLHRPLLMRGHEGLHPELLLTAYGTRISELELPCGKEGANAVILFQARAATMLFTCLREQREAYCVYSEEVDEAGALHITWKGLRPVTPAKVVARHARVRD